VGNEAEVSRLLGGFLSKHLEKCEGAGGKRRMQEEPKETICGECQKPMREIRNRWFKGWMCLFCNSKGDAREGITFRRDPLQTTITGDLKECTLNAQTVNIMQVARNLEGMIQTTVAKWPLQTPSPDKKMSN